MTGRGRIAKSAKEHARHGSFRASLHGERAVLEAGVPPMPRWLSPSARAEWQRVVRLLKSSGILSVADLGILTAYCTSWGDFKQANEHLRQVGTTTTGSKGQLVEHPEVKRAERAEARMITAGRLLGLNPASRLKARIGHSEPVDDDEQEFFGVVG